MAVVKMGDDVFELGKVVEILSKESVRLHWFAVTRQERYPRGPWKPVLQRNGEMAYLLRCC
jgi:hypothetical protein